MANGIEWPGMARGLPSLSYLPMRGPRMMAPMRAAQPPTLCTTVEPAKSAKACPGASSVPLPSRANQPPPQNQWTTTG